MKNLDPLFDFCKFYVFVCVEKNLRRNERTVGTKAAQFGGQTCFNSTGSCHRGDTKIAKRHTAWNSSWNTRGNYNNIKQSEKIDAIFCTYIYFIKSNISDYLFVIIHGIR